MRELKLRAWAKDTKEMIPWEEAMFPEWLECVDIVLMQYTGLKDKSGVEIYEGDICKYWMDDVWNTGKIVWGIGGWEMHVYKLDDRKLPHFIDFKFQSFIPTPGEGNVMRDQFQVIGNIWEDNE